MDAGTTEQAVGAAGAAVAEVAKNPDALTTGIPWLDATVQAVAALYALATVLGLGKHLNAFFYLCAKLGMDVPGLVKFVAGVIKAFKARKLKVPPTAMVLLLVSCTGLLQPACSAAQVLQTVKTVNDIARDLCMMTGVEKTGLDPKAVRDKFCETQEQLDPWIGIVKEGQATGAMQTGMGSSK
jgi:hypothetical protein